MSTVKIPGIGTVPKGAAAAGAAAIGGIVLYAYYRRSHSGAGADAGTGTGGTGDNSGAIDPSTGLPYDQESGGTGYGLPGYGGYGGYGGYDPNAYYPSTSSSGYSTNLDWEEAAVSALADQGVTTSTASAALSRVLAGLAVTTAQKNIFLQAVGLLGNPPNGYSTPIHVSDSASSGSSSTAKPGWAYSLKISSYTATTASFSWKAATHATGYNILQDGRKVHSTTDTTYKLSGLKPNTLYTLGITPYNHYGDGPTSHVQVHTKKK